MVEGHGVHRVASLHRRNLVGHRYKAHSPNGRFAEGARAIDGKVFRSIEAVGKNLFAFFGDEVGDGDESGEGTVVVVVHVHFGMAGNWAVYDDAHIDPPPDPRPTNRLRLERMPASASSGNTRVIADLHAMTVQHGTRSSLYRPVRSKLGEDPLRSDADPTRLFRKLSCTRKSIGALLNDQAYFTGPGNIYRAEILFMAGIHPDRPGKDLTQKEFEKVWFCTVKALRMGYETGSIVTVQPEEAAALGRIGLRRWIYNTSHCPKCASAVKTWKIAGRTCYACLRCQPMLPSGGAKKVKVEKDAPGTPNLMGDCVPFNSHCARESVERRLADGGPGRLTVKELREELTRRGVLDSSTRKKKSRVKKENEDGDGDAGSGIIKRGMTKKELVELFHQINHNHNNKNNNKTESNNKRNTFLSSEEAALEKARAGENLAVEHVAELAPMQARDVRRGVVATTTTGDYADDHSEVNNKKDKSRKRKKRSAAAANVVVKLEKEESGTPKKKKKRKAASVKLEQEAGSITKMMVPDEIPSSSLSSSSSSQKIGRKRPRITTSNGDRNSTTSYGRTDGGVLSSNGGTSVTVCVTCESIGMHKDPVGKISNEDMKAVLMSQGGENDNGSSVGMMSGTSSSSMKSELVTVYVTCDCAGIRKDSVGKILMEDKSSVLGVRKEIDGSGGGSSYYRRRERRRKAATPSVV